MMFEHNVALLDPIYSKDVASKVFKIKGKFLFKKIRLKKKKVKCPCMRNND